MSGKVVWRGKYAAIKSSHRTFSNDVDYDVWSWNVWKLKWTRMALLGSGFGLLTDAMSAAQAEDFRIEYMLSSNRVEPPPLK